MTHRLILLLILFQLRYGFSQDATTPGTLENYSTIHSIGFEWDITGDDNHDATCTVQYREFGNVAWLNAMPLDRVDFQSYNMLAGSILFLEPGTTYEIILSLTDSDGGNITRQDTVATNIFPVIPAGGNVYYVMPGTGGGDGSAANPFQGIDAAEAVAQPGDIFLLASGNYGGTVFFNAGGVSNNHIVWQADAGADPVFEGVRIEADYIWLNGVTVVDQQYGLRTSPPGPVGVCVTNCNFFNNNYSIFLNDGGSGWYIADNTIVGDNDPAVSNFSGEGIELQHTNGHTVCYNKMSRTADGVSYPTTNVDIFGNEIFNTSDDGIEGDYGHANIRIWGNRITNPRNNGISFQPMNGAPWYVLYNQVTALSEDVLKLRDRSDRALIAHNTFIARNGPVSSGSGFLRNMEIKNNLWVSIQDRYIWEESQNVAEAINWKTDFDYNGFDWGGYPYAFKWDNFRYTDIQHFTDSTGQETNGIQIDHSTCFDSLNYSGFVDSFFIEYYVLDSNCNVVDAGVVLSNINEHYVGTAPDLGAYEVGKPLPHYGPRYEDIQTISMGSGWNMISSYVDPWMDDMSTIFLHISSDILLVKDESGDSFIPSLGINTISKWKVEQGYKVKTSARLALNMIGQQVDPTETPIFLTSGWHIISYLRDFSMLADQALAGISSDLLLAKNSNGDAYIPSFSINTIGNLVPGQGYQVKLRNAVTLIYP